MFLSRILAGCVRVTAGLYLLAALLPAEERKKRETDLALPEPLPGTGRGRTGGMSAILGGMLRDTSGEPGRVHVIPGCVGAVVFAAVTALPGVPDWRIAAEAVLIAVIAGGVPGTGRSARRADVKLCLYVAVFYEIAVAFWQFLLTAGVGIALRLPAFPEEEDAAGQAGIWLTHLFLAVLVIVLWRMKQAEDGKISRKRTARAGSGRAGREHVFQAGNERADREHVAQKGNGRAKQENAFQTDDRKMQQICTVVVLIGFVAVITLSEQTLLAIPEDTLDMWTVLAVVLMMSVLVFRIRRQYEVERELAELKSGQAELLERDYTALRDTYAAQAKLFHDFHNHIGVLQRLLSHEKLAEAVQYLDELQAPVRGLTDAVWTGDDAADYLINSKAAAAAKAGIRFAVEAEFPRHADVRSADLCAVLGNLLDNALEAAGQVRDEEQRYIRLVIRRIHQMLVIKVENGFREVSVDEKGELRSMKRDGGLHGWGLKSAQTAAEKYDGMVQTYCEGQKFVAVATLSFI